MKVPKNIIFSKNQIRLLANHSKEKLPNESCGILFGSMTNDQVTIKEVFLAENIEKSPLKFTISNEELIQIYEMAEKKNLEISGIFHSHPNSPSYPSITDKKFMEINPIPWIIFSNTFNEFKAYIFDLDIVSIPVVIL